MFGKIINSLFVAGVGELRRVQFVLLSILIATAIGIVPILIYRPSVGTCIGITLVPWIFTAYRLFSIQRMLDVHLAGEAFELLTAFGSMGKNQNHNGAFDNQTIRLYLIAISGIFLVQTSLFLTLPLYVNYTDSGLATTILIVMLSVIIGISSGSFFVKMLRVAVAVTVVVYSALLVFVLFPQVGFYLSGLVGQHGLVAPSTAKLSNELVELQHKQQEKIDNDFVKGVIAWQEANPGVPLPKEYQDAFDRARNLGRLK